MNWRIAKLGMAFALCTAAADGPGDIVFLPGTVSTPAAEIRMAFSPDGTRMLWGAVGRDGPRDAQDIWESHREAGGWSAPMRVSFDTEAVEFDPAFSPDGSKLYFHSDRPGGHGGTDIYVADIDTKTGAFSTPRNLGPGINSKGEEWAPMPTRDGRLIFASDGWGGMGEHDLFEARIEGSVQERPTNLGKGVNGPVTDFDGALSHDGGTLFFSSGSMDAEPEDVRIYRSDRTKDGTWGPRKPIAAGCAAFAIGSSIDPNDPSHFYYAAKCDGGPGRMDIRRVDVTALKAQ